MKVVSGGLVRNAPGLWQSLNSGWSRQEVIMRMTKVQTILGYRCHTLSTWPWPVLHMSFFCLFVSKDCDLSEGQLAGIEMSCQYLLTQSCFEKANCLVPLFLHQMWHFFPSCLAHKEKPQSHWICIALILWVGLLSSQTLNRHDLFQISCWDKPVAPHAMSHTSSFSFTCAKEFFTSHLKTVNWVT